MTNAIQFKSFFSTDSAKAVKADKYGYLNGINYMSPHESAGVGNLCANASPGCIALCLGIYSGQAAMVADLEHGTNSVRESRKRKSRFFVGDVQAFLLEACMHIVRLIKRAQTLGKTLCIRMNGATDIPFERIIIKSRGVNIFDAFPDVQFVDYTKRFERLGKTPANLHLTFSRSEINEGLCKIALARGHNVAVVIAGAFPATYLGAPVVSGDLHDLRHLDPTRPGGYVIALTPKGNKAKRDASGFVVRLDKNVRPKSDLDLMFNRTEQPQQLGLTTTSV
tara:strand:- start:87 stop:926 length:840 start_codon:yes stop_codon:yes gene_type:complete